MNRHELMRKMNEVLSEVLREKGYISFVDILIRMDKLTKDSYEDWRFRRNGRAWDDFSGKLAAARHIVSLLRSKSMARIPPNSVGLAGEFAVLSQLTLRGYNAAMTLGHTKGIDILVHHAPGDDMYQVEVKTNLEERNGPTDSKLFGRFVTGWRINEKHEDVTEPDLFYCFVHINASRTDSSRYDFRFFILPSAVVAKYVREEHAYWLDADPSHRKNPGRTFRVGLPDQQGIKVRAPLASDWENNWDFRREPLASPDPEKIALATP